MKTMKTVKSCDTVRAVITSPRSARSRSLQRPMSWTARLGEHARTIRAAAKPSSHLNLIISRLRSLVLEEAALFWDPLERLASPRSTLRKQTASQCLCVVTQHFQPTATYTHPPQAESTIFRVLMPMAVTNLHRHPLQYSEAFYGGASMKPNTFPHHREYRLVGSKDHSPNFTRGRFLASTESCSYMQKFHLI